MVRYHEFQHTLLESDNIQENISEELLKFYFVIYGIHTITPEGVRIDGGCQYRINDMDENDDDYFEQFQDILKITPGQLPITFIEVTGIFECNRCKLNTLKGAPKTTHTINCDNNLLTSLEHCPEEATDFYCNDNKIKDFRNSKCNVDFLTIRGNPLESFAGIENWTIKKIYLDWNPDLPLLRLLSTNIIKFQMHPMADNEIYDISKIVLKYKNEKNLSLNERVLQCKIALERAGYQGNARW